MISQLVMFTQNPILHNLTSFHTLYKIINTWQICIFQGFSALWNTKCHKSLSEEARNLLVRKTYGRNCSTGKQELSTGNRQVCYWSTQLILEVVSVNICTMKKHAEEKDSSWRYNRRYSNWNVEIGTIVPKTLDPKKVPYNSLTKERLETQDVKGVCWVDWVSWKKAIRTNSHSGANTP